MTIIQNRNKSRLLLFTFLFAGSLIRLQAQSNTSKEERSIETIRRGVNLHDEKKYDEALIEFNKIPRNDSNYYLASVEALNTYLTIGKNEEGLSLCEELLKLKNDYTPNILILKGDFLDNLERYEEADKIYDQGAIDYPLNHSFLYEKAVTRIRKKKYDEAMELLVKTIRINPFHASSHYQLGLMAYRNGNITATMLALQFYLLCDATSERATGTVIDLEKISKGELEIDTLVPIAAFKDMNDFSEMESILKSKVGLSKKYKSKVDLTFDLVKQMQVLLENIHKYKSVKGFYNDYYGQFFTSLYASGYFEPYVYYCLKGMNLEKVNKWLQKNKSDLDKFETWAYNSMCRDLASYDENLNGKTSKVPHWFSNGSIMGAGERNKNGMNHGYWKYYYKNGIRRSEGEFVNGNKVGLWKDYYVTGGIKEEAEYEMNVEKTYKSFYENNNPKLDLIIEKNKIVGEKKIYYSNGNVSSITTYKDGEINGPQTYFYRNGSKRYTLNNVKEQLSGDLIEYFDNGKIYQKVKFVNNNREGESKTYYNNSGNTVSTEGAYVKNKPVGDWKSYYNSGKLYKEFSYKDGELDGPLKEYYENGKLNSDETYSNGKLNGLSKLYTEDGVLWQEFFYKKGKLLEYRAFRKDGSKICDNKINGRNFKLVLYHANGLKRREGEVSDGELEGAWKDYNRYGVLIRETNYKEGKEEGKTIEYFHNGKVKQERMYEAGTENGPYRAYYINGQLEQEGEMLNGSRNGYWKEYAKNGVLQNKLYYIEGDVEGWMEYYDVNGKLSSENLYREYCLVKVLYHDTNGLVRQNIDLPGGTGLLERKLTTGEVTFRKRFEKDYAEGVSESFYPDGKKETSVPFIKGKREGKWTSYNPLGVLLNEVSYFNDQKEGKEIWYSDDGKKYSEYNYRSGDNHGLSLTYHENGKIYRDVIYEYGDAEGESNMYDDFGELIYRRNFHHDLLVSYTYYDSQGKLVNPVELKPGETKVNCFYKNGKKSLEVVYLDGDLHGKRLVYFSNGKLMDESEFYYDLRHGATKEFYPSGALKLTEHFFYGDREGKAECFHENGKVKWEKNYRKGERHGWFKFYDEKGVLLKSVLYYNDEAVLEQ